MCNLYRESVKLRAHTTPPMLVGGRVASTYIDLIPLEFRESMVTFNLALELKPMHAGPKSPPPHLVQPHKKRYRNRNFIA